MLPSAIGRCFTEACPLIDIELFSPSLKVYVMVRCMWTQDHSTHFNSWAGMCSYTTVTVHSSAFPPAAAGIPSHSSEAAH